MAKYRLVGQRPKPRVIDKRKVIRIFERSKKSINHKKIIKELIKTREEEVSLEEIIGSLRKRPITKRDIAKLKYLAKKHNINMNLNDPAVLFKELIIQRMDEISDSRRLKMEYEEDMKQIRTYKAILEQHTLTGSQKINLTLILKRGSAKDVMLHISFLVKFLEYKQRINRAIIEQNPCVYSGAASDIHTPLFMGARNIDLLDPEYSDSQKREFVVRNMMQFGKITKVSEFQYTFYFDFGKGLELVTVNLIPEYSTRFKTKRKYGLILGYRSQESDRYLSNSILVHNGYRITSDQDYFINPNGRAIKIKGKLISNPKEQSFKIYQNT